ncbi:uncharacterized protein LOC124657302 [Lolium rigidum]|uniref:uncharacterized protein LOC124657302 n=1 Tax=Lolium rigidum TaxID=89674 RepID=UPI001F5C8F28|nr:uncharacterized protein LOC124657302 [Lolium rigidum]
MSMLREGKGNRGRHSQSQNGSMIASLPTGNNSPCQDDAGPDLPEEIWQHLCSLVPMRDAARAACVSRVFLSSWRCHPNLTFTKETMFSKKKLRKWAQDPTDKTYDREYNRNIDRTLANHRGPGVKKLMLHFHGPYNSRSFNRLNSWLRIAITPVLEELTLFLLSEKSKYNFPCSLLSDGSGNTIRNLYLCNCVLRPSVSLSLRYLTKLYLHQVCIAENELLHLLSSSSSLESLILTRCEDIIRLEIPCQLQRLRWLKVFDCPSLQLIENKAPNISICDFTGDELQLSLGESLQLKNLTLNRRCAIKYAIDKLASSVPNLETLKLYSLHEIVDAPMVPKLLHLKVLHIHIDNWSSGQEYDFLSLVSFLDASPSLETFSLFVPVQSNYDFIAGDPSTLRQMSGRHHEKLKTVTITGFCRQKSLVELTRHILESATSLKSLTLNTIDAEYWFYGHSSIRKCPTLDKEYIREVWESIRVVKTYIEGKVPSTVKFKAYGPCSQCHAF